MIIIISPSERLFLVRYVFVVFLSKCSFMYTYGLPFSHFYRVTNTKNADRNIIKNDIFYWEAQKNLTFNTSICHFFQCRRPSIEFFCFQSGGAVTPFSIVSEWARIFSICRVFIGEITGSSATSRIYKRMFLVYL